LNGAEDWDALAAESDLRPAVLVVSGDVAEWSMPAEYAAALGFLKIYGQTGDSAAAGGDRAGQP
jgi:3',5'-cyclic AMP phosphodiesterase CpdA